MFDGSWWRCADLGQPVLSCVMQSHVKWLRLICGALWWWLQRIGGKRSTSICRVVGQILLQMNGRVAYFIDHTQHIYSFSRIHCVLNLEPIDENVFPLPLDEPHY